MSLSTLQAQLAALSGRSKNPGSVYASSKKHDQAVGRGLHFSTQHGHSIQTKFAQPSLLAATAKEAADTPLQALTENCRIALTELSSTNPQEAQFWLNASRICNKDNVQYKVVQEVLVHLSASLRKISSVNASWHVLEYLLRRYELHVSHFEDLLWTLWPSADQYPAIFLRALKCIDLGEHPSYMWLRAYTTSETIPPRQQLSQHVMKHKDLLKKVCTWSNLVADLSGAASVLSFTAAILVEGLAWTRKQAQEDLEGISKIIFPTVLSACVGASQEWKGWGWVVSSVLVETMPLSSKYLEILMGKILEDSSSSAVMVVISLLSQNTTELSLDKRSHYLPLGNGSHLGCAVLPKDTREKLVQIPGLPSMLGELQQEIVIAPFVASLLVGCLAHGNSGIVIEMIREKSLELFWEGDSEIDMVASLSSFIVHQVLTQNKSSVDSCKVVLDELHRFDPMACERGIGRGIQWGNRDQEGSTDVSRKRLLSLLDGVIELTPTTEDPSERISLDMLPARVGIEHADSAVRLQAIARLVRDDVQGDLLATFLRRWASEDENQSVALAACNATIDCLQKDINIYSIEKEQALQWTFEACCFWAKEFSAQPSASGVKEILCKSVFAAGLLCGKLIAVQHYHQWKSIVQIIVAHVRCKENDVSILSQKLFVTACGRNVGLSVDLPRDTFNRALVEDVGKWMSTIPPHGIEKTERTMELMFRHTSITLLIETITNSSDEGKESGDMVFRFCVELLKAPQPYHEVILKGLKWCIEKQEYSNSEIVKNLTTLCSAGSEEAFEEAVVPSIEKLLSSVSDDSNQSVSPLTVALEVATRSSVSPKASVRLLRLAKRMVEAQVEGPWLCLVPALSLIEQSDQRIREASKELLLVVAERMESDCSEWKSISLLCRSVLSSVTWTGESIVSRGLSACSGGEHFDETRRKLLTLSYYTAIGIGNARCTTSSNNIPRSRWLPCGAATGGETSASNLFKALETTSEEVLPLLLQWDLFGRPMVDLWLSADYRIGKSCLVHVIVRLLLEAHRSSSSLMIMSGPGQSGRRTRSYSFGKGDESPYPRDMLKSIIALLAIDDASESVRSLAIAVVTGVVAQSSWQEHVYKRLPRDDRNELSSSILKCVGNSAFMVPDEFFTNFPFDCTDVLHLVNVFKASMTSLILLADFIRVNATDLFAGTNANELCKSFIMVLSDLNKEDVSNGKEELDRMDYALNSVLRAINEALTSSKCSLRFDKKDLQTLAKCISTVLCTNEAIDSPSSRTRLAAQELLTSMCGLYPVESLPLLISVILSAFESCEPANKARQRQSLLSRLVPVYMQCARSAKMTMHQLLGKVVLVVRTLKENDQKRVFYELSDAIATHCLHTSDKQFVDTNATIGTLVTEFITYFVLFKNDSDELLDTDVVESCLGMISRVPVIAQASSLLLLLHYVEALTAALQGESIESDLIPSDDTILPSVLDICSVPLGQEHDERLTFLKVAVGIMRTVNEALNFQSIRKLLRRNNTDSSYLSLQLWQNVLSLEARLHGLGYRTGSDGLHSLLSTIVDDCRDLMQDILPIPLFLASTMSVIREATSDQLRVNALRLIAERSLNLDPSSAEFSLFLDIIPEVSSLISVDNASSSQLEQGAFILVEHLARALPANYFGDKEKASCQKQFLELMARSVQAVQEQLGMITKNQQEFSTIDACCYSALCGASLVRILGPKCLPLLPKFVKALNSILVISNSLCNELKSNIVTEIRLCQLATMRSILCIVDSVPQFLSSYLGSLLKPDSLLAPCLYNIMSDDADCKTVISIRDRLGTALSTRVTPRSFVPAASKAMEGCSLRAKVALLSMLKQSVEAMLPAECSSQIKHIFSAIMNAFESSFSCDDRLELMQPGCDLFLAVIMKISEVQLRKLFVLFKEWRGDFKTEEPEAGAEKRHAYWFVCSHLSKALRGIFLPCLTITFNDAVLELQVATKIMCKATDTEKRGSKRRRVEDQGDLKYGIESFRSLQPLCLCLEYALTADAHQGGNWIRGDDNQKYEALLAPLGKLLQARFPMDFPSKVPDVSGFQALVLGPALQSGSVIGCLKALACAGGNEQLWKPLNHAVLEACGNETRNEVKRAGLTCLLSLIESLGDEYLVLIPECLPVLSELLEDSDEDVAALAKDIVTLAEEMLGESLESSLR